MREQLKRRTTASASSLPARGKWVRRGRPWEWLATSTKGASQKAIDSLVTVTCEEPILRSNTAHFAIISSSPPMRQRKAAPKKPLGAAGTPDSIKGSTKAPERRQDTWLATIGWVLGGAGAAAASLGVALFALYLVFGGGIPFAPNDIVQHPLFVNGRKGRRRAPSRYF